jgi:hypothetical protein
MAEVDWDRVEEEPNVKKSKESFLDKEIDFKFSPRPFIRVTVLLFLFGTFFFLGRLSVGEIATVDVVEPLEENGGLLNGLSGFFSFGANEPETEVIVEDDEFIDVSDVITGATVEGLEDTPKEPEVEKEEEKEEEKEVEEEVEEEEKEEEKEVEEEVEEEEKIIKIYGKVDLAIEDVEVDWMETWGRIKRIKYTIINNHEGTIKPDEFKLSVEGYSDIEKPVPLPGSSKIIKAGMAGTSVALVPGGFAYTEKDAGGNLGDVTLTLSLIDSSGSSMATVTKNVDLSG